MSDTDKRLIAADRVEGADVYDRQGDKLGTVKHVFIDKMSGQAEFACMSFGGVLGMGEKYHPLPWKQLNYDTEKNGYRVDLDRDTLKDAPAYDSAEMSRDDITWGEDVNRYYSTRGRAF